MDRLIPVPIEPPSTPFAFPDPRDAGDSDVVAIGGDLSPGTVLAAYRQGMFPMDLPGHGLAWWSPVERGIIPLDGLRVTRSLRRSVSKYDVTIDRAFRDVVEGCADPRRPHGWITDEIRDAYLELHHLGWTHSVEAWVGEELAGGLYGVAIGGAFFGESMFHRRRDASKVALVHLVETLREGGAALLDVQWVTDHLASLGAVPVSRSAYLAMLASAVSRPLPGIWSRR